MEDRKLTRSLQRLRLGDRQSLLEQLPLVPQVDSEIVEALVAGRRKTLNSARTLAPNITFTFTKSGHGEFIERVVGGPPQGKYHLSDLLP